jgi:hypothetical protein
MKKGYKQTEVGVIPEDWCLQPIGQVVNEFRGGAPLKPSDFKSSGVKVLPKGGVGYGGQLKIREKDLQFCAEADAASHSRTMLICRNRQLVVGTDLGHMAARFTSNGHSCVCRTNQVGC